MFLFVAIRFYNAGFSAVKDKKYQPSEMAAFLVERSGGNVAVTVDKLKNYLKIDTDYEDDLLENFIGIARAYLVDAISNFEENYSASEKFADKADLLTMIIATEFYQNRDNSAHDFSYTINSLMVQLQNFIVEGGD